jgi:putative nucleotidyltransferase with HDIG domain
MRRKWSSFGFIRGLELSPQRAPLALEKRNQYHLAMMCVLLAGVLWGSLVVRAPTTPGLTLGNPSPRDIWSNRSMSFTSDVLTEEKRFRAENAPENIAYSRDTNVLSEQRTQLSDLLRTIEQIRNDPQLEPNGISAKLAALPNSTLVISSELASSLAYLTTEQWETVRQNSLTMYDSALNTYNYTLNAEAINELRQISLPYWVKRISNPQIQQIVYLFTSSFLKANSVLDEETTARNKQEARNAVQPVTVQIQAGESIVRQGEIVTTLIEEKLRALGEVEPANKWQDYVGRAGLSILVSFLLGFYILRNQRAIWMHRRSVWVIFALIAICFMMARLVIPLGVAWEFMFPLAAIAILLAALFNAPLAIVVSGLLSLLIGFVSDNQLSLQATLMFSSIAGILVVRRGERTLNFLLAGLAVTLVIVVSQSMFLLSAFSNSTIDQFLPIALTSITNGLLSALVALGLYNLAGHLADVVTPLQLMELAHPAQPLLRKLIREAPGTYYHSISVGNLAESAAEAIGADALLLRVAAYYHDIGKTIRPYFYTDNQSDRENVHNDLDPQTSAEIICEHVTEGEKMAKQARLPRQIVDFIPTHHGTSVIKHFYQLALQQQDTVNINNYRYPGPKPSTREQGILMLADTVEATVRSKAQNGKILSSRDEHVNGPRQPGMQTIEELVSSIIEDKMRTGQLDDCELMVKDITKIRQAFITTLQGIYHPRVDYTPQLIKPQN